MIPKNTSKLILFLLKNIDPLGYNINKIAKNTNVSVGSAFKILKDIEKDKLVVKRTINNASHYLLNYSNPELNKLCELMLLIEKRNLKSYAKLYADDLCKFNSAEMIVLFGSVLKDKEFNDIDVLFLTTQIKKVSNFCLDLSKIRTKPVVPLIMKKEDLIQNIKNDNSAIINIIKEGIVIKGESIFLEVIKNVY